MQNAKLLLERATPRLPVGSQPPIDLAARRRWFACRFASAMRTRNAKHIRYSAPAANQIRTGRLTPPAWSRAARRAPLTLPCGGLRFRAWQPATRVAGCSYLPRLERACVASLSDLGPGLPR